METASMGIDMPMNTCDHDVQSLDTLHGEELWPNEMVMAPRPNGTPAEDDSSWEVPIPFTSAPVPLFPTDALPDWLRMFVEAEALATQTPPDLAALLSLAVLAAASAKKAEVEVADGYVEPLNIYTAIALPPGNRKSAVFRDVAGPLLEFEAQETERLQTEVIAAATRRKLDEERLKKLSHDAVEAEEYDTLANSAVTLARELELRTTPRPPRLVVDDATSERLSALLHENQGRLAALSPEGGLFDLMGGKYSAKNSGNFDVYLKAHAGDTLRVDRISRSGEYVTAPALTIGLAVQPAVIRGLASQPAFRGRGLLARFLYALPPSLVGRRVVQPPPVPAEQRDAYRDRVRALLQLPVGGDDRSDRRSRLSPGAAGRDLQFAHWLEPQLAETGALGCVADWAGKLRGAVLRIAGILHMAEHSQDAAPWAVPLAEATLASGVRIGHYLIAHARAAFALMGADPMVEHARFLLQWLQDRQQTSFTERDLFDQTKGRFHRMDVFRPALQVLAQHHYIRERPVAVRSGPGRRPSLRYEVNPACLSHYSNYSQNTEGLGLPATELGA